MDAGKAKDKKPEADLKKQLDQKFTPGTRGIKLTIH